MTIKSLVLLSLFAGLFANPVYADVGEVLLGGMYQRIDYRDPVVQQYGLSLRYRHLFSNSHGWIPFVQADMLGKSPILIDLTGGALYRTQGKYFLDAGVGAGYSYLFGPYGTVLTGAGFELNSRVHFVMSFLLQYPGRVGFYLYPTIGWRF